MGFYLYALREEKFSKNIYREPSLRERIFTVHQVQHLVKAYELPTDIARCDTTSLSVYHQPQVDNQQVEQALSPLLLHKGHSKDRRVRFVKPKSKRRDGLRW